MEQTRPGGTPTPESSHIAALDGLRAVAVLLILVSHSVIFGEFSFMHDQGLMGGYIGMCLFFVLSGYLITRILIREEDRFGDVSLNNFYVRRAFRLFPALWLYLAVVWALWQLGLIEMSGRSLVASLLYVRNLVGRGDVTSHLWSLSLEEQFYLIWPFAFVFLKRQNERRLLVAAAIIAVVFTWRCFASYYGLASIGQLYIRTDFRFDSPLIGCALALVERTRPNLFASFHCSPLRADLVFLSGVAILCGWTAVQLKYGQFWGVDSTVVSVVCAVALAASVGARYGIANRVLMSPPLVMIGKMSYGIYLWQGLFMGYPVGTFSEVRRFPWNLASTFAVAALSYVLLEKPLLRIKDRAFHRRLSTDRISI